MTVTGCRAAVEEYYRLQPTSYTTLRSLQLTQTSGPAGVCEQRLSIVLSKDINPEDTCLHTEFHGVRNLQLNQPDWSLISIGHLEIVVGRDIPDINSNYLVRDPEQERILWFECREFTAFVG